MKTQLPNKPVQRCEEWTDSCNKRCNRPAKYIKVGLTGKRYLCGIHARYYSKYIMTLMPIEKE